MSKGKFPSYKMAAVADLIPYANNARTHSDEQVAQIAASIKEFGFINPVVTDAESGIVAGHGRVLAARKLGMTEVPTVEVGWLTKAQKKAYILADNKLALNAGWDNDLLRVEVEALQEMKFDVMLVGFSDLELQGLLSDQTRDDAGDSGNKLNTLSERFGVPPFSVLNAREGWWQNRKSSWFNLGIQSELGRGGGGATCPNPPSVTQNADGTLNYNGTKNQSKRFDVQRRPNETPGGSLMPAANYSKRQRGNGLGRPL